MTIKIKTRGSDAEEYAVESADNETAERQSSPNGIHWQMNSVGSWITFMTLLRKEEALCLAEYVTNKRLSRTFLFL